MLKKPLVTLPFMLCLSLLSTTALTDEKADELIKYRKNVMKSIGGHAGAIGAIAQGKVDMDHLRAHVVGLNASSKTVRDIFPAESADGDTAAKAEIWSQPDEFKQAVMNLETASDDLLKAVDSGGDVGAALKTLFGSCKGCHDDFRQKKE